MWSAPTRSAPPDSSAASSAARRSRSRMKAGLAPSSAATSPSPPPSGSPRPSPYDRPRLGLLDELRLPADGEGAPVALHAVGEGAGALLLAAMPVLDRDLGGDHLAGLVVGHRERDRGGDEVRLHADGLLDRPQD